MINSHNVTKHACTSSWLPLAHSVHHTYHQVTVMDKQQKKQRLYTTHIYIYIYIYHVNVTQTVPDISPLMPMHQDTLLVDEMSWHACVTTALDTWYCRHFHSLFALPWWPGGWDCVVVWTPWSNTTYQPMREVVTTCVRLTLTHQGRVTHVMPLLVQMMACRLIIGKPLTKPVLTYY